MYGFIFRLTPSGSKLWAQTAGFRGNSTQLINQARAFLLERGIAMPQGKHKFAAQLPEIL